MTETLPTPKEADFNDVLAGVVRFGWCGKDTPADLEGLKHYREALAFSISNDLIDIRNLLDCDLAMGADVDFMGELSRGHTIRNAATRICALAELGANAGFHIEDLKAAAK